MNVPSLARSRVANHQPVIGRLRRVFVSLMFDGQQVAPVHQVLIANGGFQATVTVSEATANEELRITIENTVISYTVPAAGATTETVANALVAEINKYENISKTEVFAGKVAPGTGEHTFVLVSSHTFTVSEEETDLAVGAVGQVAGSSAKGATSTELFEPITGRIEVGQHFCFADAFGEEHIAKLTATALPGQTEIQHAPLTQAIAGGERAEFPCYVFDRTAADVARTYNGSSFQTFDTEGETDGTYTTVEKSLSIPGQFNIKNAGWLTLRYAAENKKQVYAIVVDPPADESGDFDEYAIIQGRAMVTSLPQPAPVADNMTADIELSFRGRATERTPFDTDLT